MIQIRAAINGLRLKFCSDITFVDYALEILRGVLAYLDIQNPTDLLIVSYELLKNAVVHGNRNDRTKSVAYALHHLGGGQYRIVVQDDGEGFQRSRAKRPRSPDVVSGGLDIVESLADRVGFGRKGTRISVLMRV